MSHWGKTTNTPPVEARSVGSQYTVGSAEQPKSMTVYSSGWNKLGFQSMLIRTMSLLKDYNVKYINSLGTRTGTQDSLTHLYSPSTRLQSCSHLHSSL